MNVLTFDKPKSENPKKISVDFWLDEDERGMVAQQITVAHYNEINPSWVRHIQVTNNYVIVSRPGSPTVGFHVDDLVKMLVDAFPDTTFAPKFVEHPAKAVNIKEGEAAEIKAKAVSEIAMTYRWQMWDGKEWKDCEGQSQPIINTTAAGGYRCIATNLKGETASNPCNVIIVK